MAQFRKLNDDEVRSITDKARRAVQRDDIEIIDHSGGILNEAVFSGTVLSSLLFQAEHFEAIDSGTTTRVMLELDLVECNDPRDAFVHFTIELDSQTEEVESLEVDAQLKV